MLIEATTTDQILNEVKKMVDNKPYQKSRFMNVYEKCKNELSITNDGLLLKQDKIVIPTKLENKIIEIAHSGHMGITKTTKLIERHVWFPNIHDKVLAVVDKCEHCVLNTNKSKIEPFTTRQVPDGP